MVQNYFFNSKTWQYLSLEELREYSRKEETTFLVEEIANIIREKLCTDITQKTKNTKKTT